MKGCEEVSEVLLDYLLGELPEDEAAGVRAHLQECPQCRLEYQNLKEVVELTASATTLRPSQEVYENLKEAVLVERPRPRVLKRAISFKVSFFRAAAIILLAAAIFVVPAIYLMPRRSSEPPSATEQPVVIERIPAELDQIPADAEAVLEAYVAEELASRAPATLAEFEPRPEEDDLEALVKERIEALIAANTLEPWRPIRAPRMGRPIVAPRQEKEKEEKSDGSSSDVNPNHSHLDPEHRAGICGLG